MLGDLRKQEGRRLRAELKPSIVGEVEADEKKKLEARAKELDVKQSSLDEELTKLDRIRAMLAGFPIYGVVGL